MSEVGVVGSGLVPKDGDELAMVREVFYGEVAPVAWDERKKFQSIIQCWNDADEVGIQVVNVCRVKIVLAVISSVSRPLIDSWVMAFSDIWQAIFVVGVRVDFERLLEQFWGHDRADILSCKTGECAEIHGCAERPRLSLPYLEPISRGNQP